MESKIIQPTFHARFTGNEVKIGLANDAKKKEKGIQVIEKGVASNPPGAGNLPEEPETEEKKPKKKPAPKKPEKPKAKGKKTTEPLTFPATIKMNHYGFVNLRKQLLEALGWSKDMTLSIVKNEDGSATVKKAA